MQFKVILKNILPSSWVYAYYKRKKGKDTKAHKELNFDVHLTEHCNLNCSGCNHFSSVAAEEFLDINKFSQNLKRLKEIFGERISYINLLGGEPFLHPELISCIKVIKEILPQVKIKILTNAILLFQQTEEFWQVCQEYNVEIWVSRYPIKLDFAKMREFVESKGLFFHIDEDEAGKDFYRIPLDKAGQQDKDLSFIMCGRGNSCIALSEGRLYSCPTVAHIRHLNRYFNENFEVTPQDYIDIYQESDPEKILHFLANPIPFCRYCNLKDKVNNVKWSVTKKQLEEWT